MSDQTLSTASQSDDGHGSDCDLGGEIVVLIECDRPLAGSSRHRLAGVDEIVIGRSAARAVAREGARLTLSFADRRISTLHATIVREGFAFVVSDRDSKNGVVVNGRRVDRHLLRHGDILECGRTFFLWRDRAARPASEPLDLDGADLPSRTIRLPTFHEPLAAQLRALASVARTELAVLVLGATGTGKELLARAIHAQSARTGAFVAVNCGALPENLVEAELFGARKGAFTGAGEDKPGLVRASDGGTLFLDEIGDLPLRAQPALLRVLQEREVLPVGATRPTAVGLRVVAATHRDLGTPARSEHFRADLLARLSGFVVRLPPLHERLEDLGLLIATLLGRHAGGDVTVSGEATRALLAYSWPLNVRELEHALRAALAVSPQRVELANLPAAIREPAAPTTAAAGGIDTGGEAHAKALAPEQQARRDELCALLVSHRGNISAVARQLGKDRVQIRRWIKSLGISVDELVR